MRIKLFRVGILAKILGVALIPMVILFVSVLMISRSVQGANANVTAFIHQYEPLMMNTEVMTRELYQWDDKLDGAIIASESRQFKRMNQQITEVVKAEAEVLTAFNKAKNTGLSTADANRLGVQLQQYIAYSNDTILAIRSNQMTSAAQIQLSKNVDANYRLSQDLMRISDYYNSRFHAKMLALDGSLNSLKLTVYIAIAVGFVLSVAVAIFLSRAMVRQLRQLIFNLKRVASGQRDLNGFCRISNDEIGDAADALIETVEALSAAENHLKDELDFRLSLLRAIPVPVFMMDMEGRVAGVNTAFEKFYGLLQRDVLGNFAFEVVNPEIALMEFGEESIVAGWDHIVVRELQEINASGKVRDVILYKTIFSRNRELAGQVGILMDITDQKAAERKIREHNERMRSELELAASLQRAFLPHELPSIEGMDVTWKFIPSSCLAGDMFNVMRLDETHLGFYILDVMGHGVSAALNAIAINYFIRPVGNDNELDKNDMRLFHPAAVLNDVNNKFGDFLLTETFFTVFYGVLDVSTMELKYARGGHPAPILLHSNGKPDYLDEGDMPLGLMKEAVYHEFRVQMQPGDKLVIYSDGLTEVINAHRELYSITRLAEFMSMHKELSITRLVDQVLGDIESFSGQTQMNDDVTVIGLEIQAYSL